MIRSILFYGIALAALLWGLDSIGISIMEARNFVTAREMVIDGHWWLPTLNGELRIAKPPLPTWLTALTWTIIGQESTFILRLPAVICGMLSLWFVIGISKLIDDSKDKGFLTGLLLLTSFYFFLMSRSGMWDIFAQAFMIGAIYLLLIFQFGKIHGSSFIIGFAFCFAASVLSKGPIGPYTQLLPAVLAFYLSGIRHEVSASHVSYKTIILGLILGLIIAAIWPLTIYFSQSGQEALRIVQQESSNWTSYNVRPFYYYWSFPTQSGLWSLLGFASFLSAIYLWYRGEIRSSMKFYLLWTLLVLFFLSVIPEKKSRYLLPILFPLALLMSDALRQFKGGWPGRYISWSLWLTTIVMMIAAIAILIVAPDFIDLEEYWWLTPLTMVFGAALSFYYLIFKKNISASIALGCTYLAIVFLALPMLAQKLYSTEVVRDFSLLSSNESYHRLPVYSTEDIRPELVWAARRQIPTLLDLSLPDQQDSIIVLSEPNCYIEDIDPSWLDNWEVIWEDDLDQNPAYTHHKPREALQRHLIMMKKID